MITVFVFYLNIFLFIYKWIIYSSKNRKPFIFHVIFANLKFCALTYVTPLSKKTTQKIQTSELTKRGRSGNHYFFIEIKSQKLFKKIEKGSLIFLISILNILKYFRLLAASKKFTVIFSLVSSLALVQR